MTSGFPWQSVRCEWGNVIYSWEMQLWLKILFVTLYIIVILQNARVSTYFWSLNVHAHQVAKNSVKRFWCSGRFQYCRSSEALAQRDPVTRKETLGKRVHYCAWMILCINRSLWKDAEMFPACMYSMRKLHPLMKRADVVTSSISGPGDKVVWVFCLLGQE